MSAFVFQGRDTEASELQICKWRKLFLFSDT